MTPQRKLEALDYINIALVVAVFVVAGGIILYLWKMVQADKMQRAEQDSRKLIATDAYITNERFAEDLLRLAQHPCGTGTRAQMPGRECPELIAFNTKLQAFYSRYNRAVSARLLARNDSDYREMERLYRNALESASTFDKNWHGMSLEGVAYAEMKLGELANAERDALHASTLNPATEFAGATYIKSLCLQQKPTTEITNAFEALRSRLAERRKFDSNDPRAKADADLEYGYLRQDAELYSLCPALSAPE
jgi:hypothetical protein